MTAAELKEAMIELATGSQLHACEVAALMDPAHKRVFNEMASDYGGFDCLAGRFVELLAIADQYEKDNAVTLGAQAFLLGATATLRALNQPIRI